MRLCTGVSACSGSDPSVCGCGNINQGDYRGTINKTKSGASCEKWDAEWIKEREGVDLDFLKHPRSYTGLEDNYCRNPDKDSKGAWCYKEDCAECNGDSAWESCDVPYCFPLTTNCSTLALRNDSMSEEMEYACAISECMGGTSLGQTKDMIFPKCQCLYEKWDCKFGSKVCAEAHKCCADNAYNSGLKASCECSIRPACDGGDFEKCSAFEKHCCEEDDNNCKCDYKMKACHLATESDLESVREICEDAASSCCPGYDVGGCQCDFWYPLCLDFPNDQFNPCWEASEYCCGLFDVDNAMHCNCDLYTYMVETLDYDDPNNYKEEYCAEAIGVASDQSENETLLSIYNKTEGRYWLNNTGWRNTTLGHCDGWYGVSCDDEGYVVELNLQNNNLTGEFPADSLSQLYKLKTMDLAKNVLQGIMAGTDIDENLDHSIFFNLRDLAQLIYPKTILAGKLMYYLRPLWSMPTSAITTLLPSTASRSSSNHMKLYGLLI